MARHKAKDLKVKTNDELKQQMTLLRKEQFNLRFQVTNGQNENPARFRQVRREIAWRRVRPRARLADRARRCLSCARS